MGNAGSGQRRLPQRLVEQPAGFKNLWDSPNLLLQKFPAEEFTATAKVRLDPRFEGESLACS